DAHLPPLLPPPSPTHSRRKGDARGQADALPLPVHRAPPRSRAKEGARGKGGRTRACCPPLP
ncbi:hypothetical protein EDB84DRAFT_1676562, partial [Lactarius hengduanensis]